MKINSRDPEGFGYLNLVGDRYAVSDTAENKRAILLADLSPPE